MTTPSPAARLRVHLPLRALQSRRSIFEAAKTCIPAYTQNPISGAGRRTIVRDSGPGSAHGVPCAGATRHSTRRRSRSAAARFMPQNHLLSSCSRGPGRLLLAVRGHTRTRTTGRRRTRRATRLPRHHCAASRSTSACQGAVRALFVSSQLAERRENGSMFGRCRGTFDAVIASRRRHGARRFAETRVLSY